MADLMEHDNEPIVVILYHREKRKWVPWDVHTTSSEYPFDTCGKRGLYFHLAGTSMAGLAGEVDLNADGWRVSDLSKCDTAIWYDHSRIKLLADKKPISDAQAKQYGFRVLKEADNPFDDANEGETDWCQICQEHHPSDNMCNHVYWADDGGGNCLGCGAQDVDYNEARDSLYRLLDVLSADAVSGLLRNLMSRKYRLRRSDSCLGGHLRIAIGPAWFYLLAETLGDEIDYERRYWPGIAWLYSLPDWHVATAMTAGWVYQWIQEGSGIAGRTSTLYLTTTVEGLQPWIRLNPKYPGDLHDHVFTFKRPKKARDAHLSAFLKDPSSTRAVVLMTEDKFGDVEQRITMTIASVSVSEGDTMKLQFGRIIAIGRRQFPIDHPYEPSESEAS